MKKFLKIVKYFLQQKVNESIGPIKNFLKSSVRFFTVIFFIIGAASIIGYILDLQAINLCSDILIKPSESTHQIKYFEYSLCGLFAFIAIFAYVGAFIIIVAIAALVVLLIVQLIKWLYDNWQEAKSRVEYEESNHIYIETNFPLGSYVEHEKFSKQQFKKQTQMRKKNAKRKKTQN